MNQEKIMVEDLFSRSRPRRPRKLKSPFKKPFNKNKKGSTNQKSGRMVLIAQDEYTSGEESDEEEETKPATSLMAVATTTTPPPSLFESPNEKTPIKKASCFIAKSSEVSSSKPPNANSRNIHDDDSSNPEIIAFDKFMSNIEGDSKKYNGALMSQLGEAHELLDKKGEIEREDAN